MKNDTTAYNYGRIQDRKIDEFIGLCKGVLADDEFNESEKKTLLKWLEENKVNDVQVKEIKQALQGNDNLDELKMKLSQYIGYELQEFGVMNASTSLPIEKMLLPIQFEGKTFCLTGKFSSAIGNRKKIYDIIEDKKGIAKSKVTLDLDYLVIGEIGNPDWIHSNSGRKIETAIKYRDERRTGLKIISEQQLLEYL